jgi:mRNA-degrading endonuclease RelE of RelBE toxin-antitoxin system
MYSDSYSEEIVKKLIKLKKKDPKHYEIIRKKMDDILQNPQNKYKFLHYDMKGINRVHIGHFVLIFRIDHQKETIFFEDYDHHDNIYR